MRELKVKTNIWGTPDGIAENIRYSLSLGLQEVTPSLVAHDGVAVIVCSGPSVVSQLENIKREKELGRPILSVNGGHDFLCANGIIPDLFLTVDPRPMPHNFKHTNDQTIYCIASRCDKTTIDAAGKNRVIYHAWGTEEENEILRSHGVTLCIGGGTTSGLRAINFLYIQGFRNFHLYGMDSCLGENRNKRWDSGSFPKDNFTMPVVVGGKEFTCNMAMAKQANEFQDIYDVMDLHVEVFGGGVLAAIIEERKKRGLRT